MTRCGEPVPEVQARTPRASSHRRVSGIVPSRALPDGIEERENLRVELELWARLTGSQRGGKRDRGPFGHCLVLVLQLFQHHQHEQLRSANSAFAGPASLAEDILVARDGALELLDGSRALSSGTYIECLDAFEDRTYACVGDGLTAVHADGLDESEPLFDMATLREPDYGTLSDAQRSDCSSRWRDVRDHLLLEGRIQAAPTDEQETIDAGSGVSETDPAAAPSTCSLRGTSRPAGWLTALLLALLLSRRARRYSASEL